MLPERPREGRWLAGVCLALAMRLAVQPALVRAVWAAATVLTGVVPGILAYFLLALVLPQEPLEVHLGRGR